MIPDLELRRKRKDEGDHDASSPRGSRNMRGWRGGWSVTKSLVITEPPSFSFSWLLRGIVGIPADNLDVSVRDT
jgi:hypothetical protein